MNGVKSKTWHCVKGVMKIMLQLLHFQLLELHIIITGYRNDNNIYYYQDDNNIEYYYHAIQI